MSDDCQYQHASTVCSGRAEFLLSSHNKQKRVCKSAAEHVWTLSKGRCYECRRPRWTHWDVIPLTEIAVSA